MSEPWSWFCKFCLESHVTSVCPLNADFHHPFRCEPDPVETMSPNTCMGELPPTYVRGPAPIRTSESAILALVQAITEQTKAINALVEQNQMLIQAMAGEEGVEEVDRYQTL